MNELWNTGERPDQANGTSAWTYELRFDQDSPNGTLLHVGRLSFASTTEIELLDDTEARSVPVEGRVNDSDALHNERVMVVRAHRELFGAFYHLSPTALNQSASFPTRDSIALAHVATLYDCYTLVKVHIDKTLWQHRMGVLQLCATHAADMLELGKATQTDWVFKEAAAHLIGFDKVEYAKSTEKLEVLELTQLLDIKRTQMVENLRCCEFNVLSVPVEACNGGITDVAAFAAESIYRDDLMNYLKQGKGSGLAPGYARVYRSDKRTIEDMESVIAERWKRLEGLFSDISVQPTVAANRTKQRFVELIRRAMEITKPLLIDVTLRQTDSTDLSRPLTFMLVSDDELPWFEGA